MLQKRDKLSISLIRQEGIYVLHLAKTKADTQNQGIGYLKYSIASDAGFQPMEN